jgi:NRPS condensation-like uncharacterized protein
MWIKYQANQAIKIKTEDCEDIVDMKEKVKQLLGLEKITSHLL